MSVFRQQIYIKMSVFRQNIQQVVSGNLFQNSVSSVFPIWIFPIFVRFYTAKHDSYD